MVRVSLPEGCFGLEMQDGKKYNADRNGRVEVSAAHAAAIRRSWSGQTGVVVATDPQLMAAKAWRTCLECRPSRRWFKWTSHCPRCGAETTLTEATA